VLAALIIVFREVFEAGLIIGIVMAATRTIPGHRAWIATGVAAGVAGSCVVATFASALSQAFAGSGQEVFNAGVLIVAVVMLTWHNVWMSRHGRDLTRSLKAAGQAVVSGTKSMGALAVVVGLAVLREGFEVVMFLYGVLATDGTTGMSVFAGGLGGMALGVMVCAATYRGLLRIPEKYLFGVTGVLIAFLAAGMAAQAVNFLAQADFVTALGATVWDTSWLLTEDSVLGRLLHTLLGYNDRPSGMQLVAYVSVLAVMFILMKVLAPSQRDHQTPMAAE
jgi:high-affinity iron transporter